MQQIIGRLPLVNASGGYEGSQTDTARVIVDDLTHTIQVHVTDAVTEAINTNRKLIDEASMTISSKANISDVRDSITEAEEHITKNVREVEDDLRSLLSALDDKLDRLVPIDVEKLSVSIPESLEVGTFFTEVDISAELNKIPKFASINYNSKSIELENLDSELIKYSIASDIDRYSTECLIDFGDIDQYVSDDFYNKFKTVATQVIQSEESSEGDTESGYIREYVFGDNLISNSDGVYVVRQGDGDGK